MLDGVDENALTQQFQSAASYIQSKLPERLQSLDVGIICGSGLHGLANVLQDAMTIEYKDIPYFPTGHVPGHKHVLKAGLIGGRKCIIFLGRFHGYEGLGPIATTLIVRVLACMGVPNLIVTNAAGSVDVAQCRVGDFLVVEDHISFPSLAGQNPLVGPNLPFFGPRFPSLHQVYYKDAYKLVIEAAEQAEVPSSIIKRGVYCHVGGPAFETPTEVKLLRLLGGAAVGMSTVPEVITAAHCVQIKKTIVISLITNEPYDPNMPGPTHEEVLAVAAARALELRELVSKLVTLM